MQRLAILPEHSTMLKQLCQVDVNFPVKLHAEWLIFRLARATTRPDWSEQVERGVSSY